MGKRANRGVLFNSFRQALCRLGNRCIHHRQFSKIELETLYQKLTRSLFHGVFAHLSDELSDVFMALSGRRECLLTQWSLRDPIWQNHLWSTRKGQEIGTAYEMLLGLSPVIIDNKFCLRPLKNRSRKYGSYYTDSDLVNEIVASVLRPLVDKIPPNRRANDSFSITICDPACGAGVFLSVAAAFLADQISENCQKDRSEVLQQVVQQCIYGVDIDPIAVALCILSLHQLSGVSPSELAQNIRCGNALLGVFDLPETIPSEAFVAVRGEEKRVTIPCDGGAKGVLHAKNISLEHRQFLSNMWCSAFLWPAKDDSNVSVPTTKQWNLAQQSSHAVPVKMRKNIEQLAVHHKLFDWKSAFPKVFAAGKRFSVVLGNPPYLFLSGKGSPIKKLWDQGKTSEAQSLAREIKLASFLYAQTSVGCKDVYKWFVLLGTKIGDNLGLVIPSGWLSLPRYSDVNQLLVSCGLHTIWNFGFGAFPGVTLPTCAIKTERGYSGKIALLDCTSNPQKPSSSYQIFPQNGIFRVFHHPLAKDVFSQAECVLGDHIAITEGAHHIKWNRQVVQGLAAKVFVDSEMRRFVAPRWTVTQVFPSDLPKNHALHQGERILLRKTGDALVSTMVSSEDVIWANQNVYVIKAKPTISIEVVQGLLASSLYTFLYQGSPFGQKGRTLAQLRLKGVRTLPFPDLKKLYEVQDRMITLVQKLNQGFLQEDWNTLNKIVNQLFGLTHKQTLEMQIWSKGIGSGHV